MPASAAGQRPNVLWITCEDMSPHLGCYGERYAVTPHLDRFATESLLYTRAFAPIGVCAPARSCLITGMYPNSIGTQHMRCTGHLPDEVKCFTEYLRAAGYYCTNNVKTDYNFRHDRAAWDESSNRAHWRNRKGDQPFFSVFNFTTTHESQIRISDKEYRERTKDFTPRERHEPARAPIPPYHPDTPEVRRDWARYHDMITVMDKQVAGVLAQLEEDGLADSTIVFYYSDHGAGMPRSKRWLYDSSTRVPLMIRFPRHYEKLASGPPGTRTDRLVSFVDFGPTVLSLVGVTLPDHLQGRPFLGEQEAEPRAYVFGYRDRMDERYDLIRSARDKRYNYIRNYRPELPWFHHQHISYMYEMPTMRVWQQLADAGRLDGPAALFMAPGKPTEELYDVENDPHEVHNLAGSPEHQEILARMRQACRDWMEQIVDLGLLPEADLRTRFGDAPEYSAVRNNPELYPLEKIAAAADLANARDVSNLEGLVGLLEDDDPAVCYWGAVGLGSLEEQGIGTTPRLRALLGDAAPAVRIAAADALCRFGEYEPALPVLIEGLKDGNEWVRLQAINVLDRIDEHARPALAEFERALKDENGYVVRVAEHALAELRAGGD